MMTDPRDIVEPLSREDLIDAIDLTYEDLVDPTLRDSLLMAAGDYQPHVRDRITALYHEAVATLSVLTAALEIAAKTQTSTIAPKHSQNGSLNTPVPEFRNDRADAIA